jgi:hypothetical protein
MGATVTKAANTYKLGQVLDPETTTPKAAATLCCIASAHQ